MSVSHIANRLSAPQRALLIEHVCAPVGIDNRTSPEASLKRATMASLAGLKLVQNDGDPRLARPRFTVLTDLGREVVCCILGQYADALVSAGLLRQSLKIDIPRRPARSTALTEV